MTDELSGCGCKGIRTCRICEQRSTATRHGTDVRNYKEQIVKDSFIYCVECMKAWTGLDQHPNHRGGNREFPGVWIIPEFVTVDEEETLCKLIDDIAWTPSQSGRRKQDFGPKVNFKKKKVKSSTFSGLPSFSKELIDRMNSYAELNDFIPVEQCHLEYTSERGSSIDPHFDDFWLWGERLVTINLNSDSYLSMTKDNLADTEVLLPLFRRSLIVISGPARHEWKHSIKRRHVNGRRLAITYRELSKEFMPGGIQENAGKELIDIALCYNGVVVGQNMVS